MPIFIFVPVSITFLLHVSMCYIHHLQGENLMACTKPSAFYCVFCALHCCAIEYNTYSFVDTHFFTMINTTFLLISLFHRAFQFTIYNGPTNALVCNKTLIQMSHFKTLKITPTYFDHQLIIIRELFDPG
jgi:hypothetical protein